MRWLWAILFWLLASCGGSVSTGRKALYVAAEALVATDSAIAEKYTDAAAKALEESASADAYHQRMLPWDNAEQSVRLSRAALFAAQSALDTFEDGGSQARWQCTVHDLILAFKELQLSLEDILPLHDISTALTALEAFATCEEP